MTPPRFARTTCLLTLATACALPALANADTWPTQPVRLVVGSPAGAPSDIIARSLAEQLNQQSGMTVVVENRPGAGLNLAAAHVASAAADGHTFLVTPDTVMTVNPVLYQQLIYDAARDLTPVSVLAGFTQMLVCNPAVGVTDVPGLIEAARTRDLTYASGGAGVPGHLAAEMFLNEAGVRMTHVPYRGPGPAITDVIGGQVDCGFLTTPQVLPHIQSGRLSALALSSAQPSAMAPNVPPMAQAGVPGMDATFYQYLMAPAATPAAIVQAMQEATQAALAAPTLQERVAAQDMAVVGSSSTEAAEQLARDRTRWGELVRSLDLRLD